MSDAAGGRTNAVCRVFEEDPELAEELPEQLRQRAATALRARTVMIPTGRWGGVRALEPSGIGLLALEGLLIRRVGVDGRYGAELLGGGDLLRPWQGEDGPPTLAITSGWRVIEPVRVAVLDEAFAQRAARFPPVVGALVGRAIKRARNLSVNMAIVHQARVDVRVHMLLWHLAGRWGKVRNGYVNLPLPLTHNVLADLAAARRPTVTTALSELAREERVRQAADGWHLYGSPPGELLELTAAPSDLAASAHARDGEEAVAGS